MKKSIYAKNLTLLRERTDKTQEDVGKLIGKSRAVYQTYESGKHQPDQETMVKFAKLYGLSVHRMLHQDLRTLTSTQRLRLDEGYDTKQWADHLKDVRV